MTSPQTRALADLEVRDSAGKRIALGSLWSAQPVLLILVRHFG